MCKNEDIPHTLSFLFLFCFSLVVLRTEILEDLQVCPRKKQIVHTYVMYIPAILKITFLYVYLI